MAKLDKLPIHVYEVDEEADKDEVGSCPLSLFPFETPMAQALREEPTFQPKQERGCLNEAKEIFKIYF